MGIFDKRPLSLILSVMLGGFVFFSYASDSNKIVIPSIAAIIFAISFFLKNTEKSKAILIRICAAALLFASMMSYVFFDLYFSIYERYEDEVEIIATVKEIETESYLKEITVSTDTVNGEDESGINLILFSEFSKCENISEGAKIKIVGTLSNFESTDSFDASQYYKSRKISAEIVNFSKIELLETNDFPLSNKLESYRTDLCGRIILNSDSESGGLLCALLFGEKTHLPNQTSLDFKRIGISHILALSGMHIAILTAVLERVLSFFRLNKKIRKVVGIIFVLVYMALTGFPVSVVRAGVMLIISSLLFLLSRRGDSVTTLLISVTFICIIDPCSVFDISLWLSALSTLGIVMLVETQEKSLERTEKSSLLTRILKFILFSLLSSVFAIGTTLLLTTSNFKTLSLLGLFATPIFSILTEILMHAGMLLLIFADIFPIGFIIKFLGEIIMNLSGIFSSINGVYLSADSPIVQILVFIFTILFFAFFILNIKRRKTAIAVLSSFLVMIFTICLIESHITKNTDVFDYTANEKNEIFFINSDAESAVIDVTTSNKNTAYMSLDKIEEQKLSEINKYIFTNYSKDLPSALDIILHNVCIDNIYIPSPSNDDEYIIYEKSKEIIDSYRTTLSLYGTDSAPEMIWIGDITFFPFFNSDDGKVAFTIKYKDEFYSYLSSGMMEDETKTAAFPIINGCHTLIFGSHGSAYSNYEFIYEIDGIDTMIVSSKNLSISDEVLEFYKNTEILKSPKRVSFIH